MKKIILHISFLVVVACATSACGTYSSLLKSTDPDLLYSKSFEYFEKGKYQKAATLLDMVRLWSLNTPRADTVMYYTGLSYYKMGDFDMSGMIFDQFRKTHGRSPFLEEAEYMYAKGFYFLSPEPDRDQSVTRQALMAIDEYLERYPNSVKKEALTENIKELMQKLHDKEFINARTYYKTGKYKAAVVALKNALDLYPESNHREELMYLITKSGYELASKSIVSLRRDRFINMMDYYYNYISEYPEGKYRKELEKMQESAKKYIASFGDGENNEKRSANGTEKI